MKEFTITVRMKPFSRDMDEVVVIAEGETSARVSSLVPREPYVEERWGRWHNANEVARDYVLRVFNQAKP